MPIRPLEELKPLSSPYEILELKDGESIELMFTDYKEGKITITPVGAKKEKEIPILRVWVPPKYKLTVPYYYDITAKTLQEGLLAYLAAPDWREKTFKITKHGIAPRARFTLEVVPV